MKKFYLLTMLLCGCMTVAQAQNRGNYAYALSATVGDTKTVFNFKSTGDVSGSILFTDDAGTDLGKAVTVASVKKGDNTVTVSNADLPAGKINWKVQINNTPVSEATLIKSLSFPYASGCAIDMIPTSPYFGQLYVCNSAPADQRGFFKVDQDLNTINETAIGNNIFVNGYNTYSPKRMDMFPDGSVVACDFYDGTSGLYMLNPANDEITQMLGGTKDASGAYTSNSVVIGGSPTGVSIVKDGDFTYIYSFMEDYPAANGYTLVCYILREGERTITMRPYYDFRSQGLHADIPNGGLLGNTNVEVRAGSNGFWAAQVRNTGQNTPDVPAFIYCNTYGNVLYSAADDAATITGCDGAIAINHEENILAVAFADHVVHVYNLNWDDSGVPSLGSEICTIPTNFNVGQMTFDIANNLYIAAQETLLAYAIPNEKTKVETPAATAIENNSSVVQVAVATTKVYPSPAVNAVNIETAEEISAISVYNVAGAMVATNNDIEGNRAVIDVESLASGIYFVRINNTETVRFIKK